MVIGMVLDEDLTVYEAARRLNALGFMTRRGSPWNHRNLQHHMRRRHLLGEMPFTCQTGRAIRQFPPIISEGRFNDGHTGITTLRVALGDRAAQALRDLAHYAQRVTLAPTPEQATVLGHDIDSHGRVLAGPGTGRSETVLRLARALKQAHGESRFT